MPSEKKIIQLKYAAPRFGDMNDDELNMSATAVVSKISIITGWTVPTNSILMNELVDQVAKKMKESYANVNLEEVEYAFRNKGLDIKDWGKALNLSMIDEVLKPYLHNRADLSMQEEKISTQFEMAETVKEISAAPMSDVDWNDWLNDISKYQLNLIPCDSYEYLVRTEKIILSKEQKHSYMDRAVNHFYQTIDPNTREGIEFLKMKKEGVYSPEVTATLITISKRLAVFDYFNSNK